MLTYKRSLLPAFTLLAHFLPAAQAVVTLHYFPHTSCNANTALSEYTSPAPASSDTSCHYAPDGTVALYLEGVDDGCTVRTYSDAACASVMGLSINVGICYYSGEDGKILSWKLVCGSGLGTDPSATDSANTTMSITSMASMSETTSTSMETTEDTSTSTAEETESPVPGTTYLVGDHTPITGKTPPPATTHTCNGNCTWTSKFGTTSKLPGFQTGGPGMNTNGADVAKLTGWRKHVLKSLVAMGAADALWNFV